MIYETMNQQPAVNIIPNNNGVGDGLTSGGGIIWVIILFLFALMMGWGGNNNAAAAAPVVYAPYGGGYGGNGYSVQQSFDQAAIMSGLTAIQGSTNNLAMGLQNCCCENRAAVADLKYTVAMEACADRAAVTAALQEVTAQSNANTQRILDTMCQDKIDAKNEKIAELQTQLQMAQLAASQDLQTTKLIANTEARIAALEQSLAPTPRPAYVVQNPN